MLSIVSPVYNADKIIGELVKRIENEVSILKLDYEIILVEDGSTDSSWKNIEEICKTNTKVRAIKLSRNFGQHYAITAGLFHAKGDWVIVMDCDLQDDPVYIKDLYYKAIEGYDIVYTYKKQRNHSFIKNFTAHLYNRVFNWLIDNKSWRGSTQVGAYSILSSKVVKQFIELKDYRRHYLTILRWLGFNHTFIEIEHKTRFSGKSSYNFIKLFNHAIDGIISQSDKLLRLTVFLGFILSFLAIIIYCNNDFY